MGSLLLIFALCSFLNWSQANDVEAGKFNPDDVIPGQMLRTKDLKLYFDLKFTDGFERDISKSGKSMNNSLTAMTTESMLSKRPVLRFTAALFFLIKPFSSSIYCILMSIMSSICWHKISNNVSKEWISTHEHVR